MNWTKSQDLELGLKSAAEGLEKLFPNPDRKAHLMHNSDGHPWIRLILPMQEVRFIGITPSRGTGPSYLKLRAFLYAEHNCWVPCDHVPVRSWALFKARDVLRELMRTLKAEQSAAQVA